MQQSAELLQKLYQCFQPEIQTFAKKQQYSYDELLAALRQIQEKGSADKYAGSGKKVCTKSLFFFCFFSYYKRMEMLEMIGGYAPWFWLAAAILFSIIEAFTFGLVTIWCALSAVVMIFISLSAINMAKQLLIFSFLSLLLLVFTKPLVRNKIQARKEKTNAASLIGKKVFILKPITAPEKGEVKINGLVWSASSADETDIAQHTACIIEKIEGVTLVVRKINLS